MAYPEYVVPKSTPTTRRSSLGSDELIALPLGLVAPLLRPSRLLAPLFPFTPFVPFGPLTPLAPGGRTVMLSKALLKVSILS